MRAQSREPSAESRNVSSFLQAYPEYRGTSRLDELRAAEYAQLDGQGHVYLDYTGGSLAADSQVHAHLELLEGRVLGNPHSASRASSASTRLVEDARRAVLEWFGGAADYVAVFTANATGAIKHVAESFPFGPGGRLLLTVDNHNSVNGIREFASRAGASVEYAPLEYPELRVDREQLRPMLAPAPGAQSAARLFAFPAQSNFTGVTHPLDLVEEARRQGWHVLLDAAAFVPTHRLDLAQVHADFVAVSFYKMFGYPTGVGCLLIRRSALPALRRPWFAGGTVNFASVSGRCHVLAPGEAGYEDGTLNYLGIPAVTIGLRHLSAIGIERIEARVRCLTGWLLDRLVALRHSSGRPLVRIYGPLTTATRGGIVTLNFYDPDGHLIDYRRVEELANREGISIRTGCFCNPGAGESAEGITEDDVEAAVDATADLTMPRFLQFITHRSGKSAGAIRVSLGIVSNFADVERFVQFAERFRDQTRLAIGEVTFDIESCRLIRDGS